MPVAVHVRRRHRHRGVPHRVVHPGGECAVSQIPQHGDGARKTAVRRNQVDVPVAVHIRSRHRRRDVPYLEHLSRKVEPTLAAEQQAGLKRLKGMPGKGGLLQRKRIPHPADSTAAGMMT